MHKHPLLIVVALAVLAALAALLVALLHQPAARNTDGESPRIVSLLPQATETLYEIGAGDMLVGRSDYCFHPARAQGLPVCGTSLTPNGEAIVRLEPTLILGDGSHATDRERLRALGNAEFLDWLTAQDVIASTRRLGVLTGKEEAANRLADELAAVLLVPEPASGPRVLVAMAHTPGQMKGVTFMKRNSLHGEILHAAGGRNAVDYHVSGVPTLSIEEVLRLDPDIIIIVAFADEMPGGTRDMILSDWDKLSPLRAVRQGRVGLLHGQHMVPAARRTFTLVKALRQEIERLGR
ncbi:MAG: ABC transporter substrate-binding protein [Planctomycetes bacterium]|nr:ABC transporter substrate-binding protein [Planctomycetota bacterium]MCW8137231.1 ABC transporter substrate-binding protein [Planctomycetota bacterium]